MKILKTINEMREVIAGWRKDGASVGLVPTMGGLHEGHISLIRLARARANFVIATSFVNPTQFAQNEDFDAYPRNASVDQKLFAAADVDLLFVPSVDEIYPKGHVTRVHVEGLSDLLEGECRPHFFLGVTTVVSKLLIQTMADLAIFGEKDYQQLQIIRRMAQDLDIPTEIVEGPTIREEDGLAMSSRNRYLNDIERMSAGKLYESICDVASAVKAGLPHDKACAEAINSLVDGGFNKIDYITVRDAETLQHYRGKCRPGRVLAAAWLGRARLIDNVAV